MFDIGFTELMVIAVVALVVIGPERLPKVARTAGHLLGRLQRYVSDVKSDINREMQLEELRKLQTTVQDSAREFELSINKEVGTVEDSLNQAAAPLLEPAPAQPAAAPVAATQLPAAGQAPPSTATPAGTVATAGQIDPGPAAPAAKDKV
jgi:sec-independent protein translocase protein TatB